MDDDVEADADAEADEDTDADKEEDVVLNGVDPFPFLPGVIVVVSFCFRIGNPTSWYGRLELELELEFEFELALEYELDVVVGVGEV